MNILFLTDNFPPERNAPAVRTLEHCRHWQKAGHEVTVITGAPNFPQGKIYPGYQNKLCQKEIINGLTVLRVWTYISANKGFAKRILDYTSFAATSFVRGLFTSADIIIATSPQFFTTLSGAALSFLKRTPWVFELRDLWPESIRAVGAMKNEKTLQRLEALELFLYRRASGIVAVTEAFKENLISRGVPEEKIEVVTNGVDTHTFFPREKDKPLLHELQLTGKTVLSYIGTHGMAHALDFILHQAKALESSHPEVHFLLLGDGAEKENLLSLHQKLELKNTTLLPPVPREEVPRYLSITDISLINLKRSETFTTVIPSKIFESAAMEKPILLGVSGEAEAIIKNYQAGEVFVPEDGPAFQNALFLLLKNQKSYREGLSRLAADYSREKKASEMLTFLLDLV